LAPTYGPALRAGFVRSIAAPKAVVQGPSLALYDSRRIPAARPLRNDSAHPSERGGWCRLLVRAKRSKAQATPTIFQATRTPSPVRRPSGGVAQGDARHGRPFVTAPGAAPERGESGHRPDPDVGRAFSLVTFSFARAKRK